MPKFNVDDVVRVLSNDQRRDGNGFNKWEGLDKFIGQVGKVTNVHGVAGFDHYIKLSLDDDWNFDAEQCELAQIQVGDRVITDRFDDEDGHYGFIDFDMGLLVGKVGVVVEVMDKGYRIKHVEQDHAWCWNKESVKFALDGGDVAPVAAPVAKAAIIKPVKPKKPKVERVKNMRAEMNKRAGTQPGTASYALQFKDGSVRWQIRDACHARIGVNDYYDKGKEAKDIKAVATAVQPYYNRLTTEKDKANYKRFAEYIIKRSPYKDCFLPCAQPVRYSVYMNLKRSINNVAAAAIALREGSEQLGGKLSTFIWLLEQGVSEDAAWVASRFFKPNGHDGLENDYSFSACYGHDAITATTKATKFFAVFKDGLYMNDKPYTEKADRYQVYACFGATNKYDYELEKDSLGTFLKKEADVKVVGQGWGKMEKVVGAGVLKAAQWIDVQIKAAREGKEVPLKEEKPKVARKPRVRKAQYKQELEAVGA